MSENTKTLTSRHEEKEDLTNKAQDFLKLCKDLLVTNDEDYQFADGMNTDGARQLKAIKTFFKPHKDRAFAVHKELCADEKKALKPIELGTRLLGDKMAQYREKIEREKREEQARIEEEQLKRAQAEKKMEEERRLIEAQKLQEQGRSHEADEVLSAPMVQAPVFTPVSQVSIPKTNTSFRKRWYVEVMDKLSVPEAYKVIDTAALDRLANATKGTQPIPGCNIKVKMIPVRSSR